MPVRHLWAWAKRCSLGTSLYLPLPVLVAGSIRELSGLQGYTEDKRERAIQSGDTMSAQLIVPVVMRELGLVVEVERLDLDIARLSVAPSSAR
jgi:hypothetical protein